MRALKAARVAAALGAALFGTAAARAEPCGRPDLLDTMPPDGAKGVPTDATLGARYAAVAEWVDEKVVLEKTGTGEVAGTASFAKGEGILSFRPAEPLAPGADYVVKWPKLRGLGTASRGTGADVRFAAGAGPDAETPRFVGVQKIAWDVHRERDECTDRMIERYVFDLTISPASDDGGRDSLALLVFQTAGPGTSGAPKQVLVERMPPPGEPVRVVQAVEGAGRTCFAAKARDLVGRVSSGDGNPTCVKTVEPPFFYGCAVGGRAGAGASGSAATCAAVAALACARRRTRRRP